MTAVAQEIQVLDRASEARSAVLRMVACGSVDDGKSTLIGRMLAETDSVPIDQLEYARRTRRGGSTIPVGEIDYSLLTDGLEAEREQGITIDVAYRHMDLPSGRRVIIADAPGHEQYTRNMAVAASTADVAVLLVDAARGLRPQTFRHLTVCALMGVTSIVVAINKMDLVGYEHATYEELSGGIRAAAARLGIDEVTVIPVSAMSGANVIESSSPDMPWYSGGSVLDALVNWEPVDEAKTAPFRLPVQMISRASSNFRGYSGTIASGEVRVGDDVVIADSGVTASVDRIVTADGDWPAASAGQAVTLLLDREVDITRGDLLCHKGAAATQPADRFAADLVWIGEEPLAHGRSYLVYVGPRVIPATVTAVRHRLDVVTGHHDAARVLEMNDIGRVELATDTPIPLDEYETCRDSGGFLLVDRVSSDTVAAGLTRHAMRRAFNVTPHDYAVDRDARMRLKGHDGKAIWLTGLSGAGKSTVADATAAMLHAQGVHTYVLDGDNVRTGLNRDLGFTPEDRAENVRRVAEVAKLMVDAGLVVIIALVSPYRADRRSARSIFEEGEFLEVFIDTPLEVAQERDPKGLYAKAAKGTLPNMTGVGQEYEPPERADVHLDGTADVAQSAEKLARAVLGE
ncbi:MAG: adenylyl-sulfate kinase [Actinomycetia bacterium]|nr:adenylyl-sulfate kinase [Actinomycetes bacterium]